MTDKSKKLAELAALCEAATAPDREMDAVIHFVIKDGIGVGYASDAPAFTASLDAALTLVPDGWTRSVDATAPECGIRVELYPRTGSGVSSDHPKEPLATCAAALLARAVQ